MSDAQVPQYQKRSKVCTPWPGRRQSENPFIIATSLELLYAQVMATKHSGFYHQCLRCGISDLMNVRRRASRTRFLSQCAVSIT